jgi:hypothetical protein
MNEHLFASRIRQALDESADRLPYRVTRRLELAREAALARAEAVAAPAVATSVGAVRLGDDRPSVLIRLLSATAPVLLVIAGLYGIALWDDAQRAAETADLDAEIVLSDDEEVPLSAYADKGFGLFLRNNRQ